MKIGMPRSLFAGRAGILTPGGRSLVFSYVVEKVSLGLLTSLHPRKRKRKKGRGLIDCIVINVRN